MNIFIAAFYTPRTNILALHSMLSLWKKIYNYTIFYVTSYKIKYTTTPFFYVISYKITWISVKASTGIFHFQEQLRKTSEITQSYQLWTLQKIHRIKSPVEKVQNVGHPWAVVSNNGMFGILETTQSKVTAISRPAKIGKQVIQQLQFWEKWLLWASANNYYYCYFLVPSVLWHCWLGGRKSIRPVKKLSGGVLAWLSVWSEVQTCIWPSWCYCHSLSLVSVKSRLVLPFWYRLTWVVPEKGPLNVCVCVLLPFRLVRQHWACGMSGPTPAEGSHGNRGMLGRT